MMSDIPQISSRDMAARLLAVTGTHKQIHEQIRSHADAAAKAREDKNQRQNSFALLGYRENG